MTSTPLPILPGRLGTPNMQLRDDPRADPRMIAAMAALGLDVAGPPPPIDAGAPLEQLRAFAAEAEAGFGGAFEALITALPPVKGVSSSTETIRGVDGNPIKLFVHRPTAIARAAAGRCCTSTAAAWSSAPRPTLSTSVGATNSLRPG